MSWAPHQATSSGGQIQETLQFSCCTFGRTGRPIAGVLGGGLDPLTLYQSFLIDFGARGTDAPTDFGKRAYEMWNGGIGDSFLAVDLFMNHFSGDNELTLEVTTPSGSIDALVDGGGLTLEAQRACILWCCGLISNPARQTC